MMFKHGRELWRSLVYTWETQPHLFVELLLLMAGSLSAVLALALGDIWPFGFLALLFLMGCSLCVLVRETMVPSFRGREHRLGAVVCFGLCLLLIFLFVRRYLALYG